jgi:hypothetical protein
MCSDDAVQVRVYSGTPYLILAPERWTTLQQSVSHTCASPPTMGDAATRRNQYERDKAAMYLHDCEQPNVCTYLLVPLDALGDAGVHDKAFFMLKILTKQIEY